ncbi:hypothetical protein DDB_G0286409 [Dictyostelium discoideum AX4]|uniref:FNIP repeat-containing protein n=1 Tax=Dictyostelium discoideum TaxID=44689 RepID=Q54LU6_DICDI|nr:hypothetical protein DDB_G0286409 [Dictyostelium discoideum AX4]EAL64229.1 hypothetical protein DDB_G0286409 [Dictyostelium discoideum AX4]|eukprot:XP_637734.1 hypothetical protein DDB_G0286409 [Dictyostelium discoideum AX4]
MDDKLFFKVFRNIYLQKEIFKHLEYYRLVFLFSSTSRFKFNAITISNYEYREYLSSIHIDKKSNNIGINPLTALEDINHSTGCFMKPLPVSVSNNIIQPGQIPESVEKLTVHSTDIICVGSFSQVISNTSPDKNYNCNIKSINFTIQCIFPNGIIYGLIPESVKNLEIHSKIINQKPIFIPNSVEKLSFYWFNQPILPSQIPDSVKHLSLGVIFNQNLSIDTFGDNSLLESIEFGYDFNKPIQFGVLSKLKNLKTIKFGISFNQPIIPFSIPEQVTSIIFRGEYIIPFPPNSIPKSVKLIHNQASLQLSSK